MKKILILGTGNAQEDVIRYCKNSGFTVHACSYTKGDSAEPYVDFFSLINIVDTDALVEYVQKNQIRYIYSVGSDIAMPSVAYVAEKCGLPHFVSYETAVICNNKGLLREHLGQDFKGNLSYVVLEACPESVPLDFPVVIKPVDSQGQRGVAKVRNMTELEKTFERSRSFSKSGRVIVEEYVEGTEISVNAFVTDGEMKFALVSDRVVWPDYPGGIIHRHLLPSRYSGEWIEQEVIDLVKRVMEKINIENGPAYFQIKVKSDGTPKLLEVTPRLDGCHMWRLIRDYTGIDLLDASLQLLQGRKVSLKYEQPRYRMAELEFLCAPPQTIFKRSLYDVSNAQFVKYYYEEGQTVKKMNGYMEKCGYIIKGCE